MQNILKATLILLAMSGCVRVVDATSRMQQVPFASAPGHSAAGQVGAMLNRERRARGLRNVSYSSKLSGVAMSHARDMQRRNYFSHRGANGSTPHRRIRSAGYGSCLSAENIAKGQRSPAEVMNSWMTSAGHRENNLRPQVIEYGLAHVPGDNYWVLLLASPGC